MDQVRTVFLHIIALPALDLPDYRRGVLRPERLKLRKPVTESRQPDRNHRDTFQLRQVLFKFLQGIFQLIAVVDAPAQDDLPVQFDPGFLQPADLVKHIPGKTVVQHPAAELRIHGMEGDIDRFQMIADNPVDIMVRHVGQGNIIPLQKTQAGVVVVEIEGFPHPRGHLVDKAEDAAVAAGAVFIHKPALKFNSEILPVILFDLELPLFSGLKAARAFPDHGGQRLILGEIAVVEYILHRLPVHADQFIPRLHSQFPGDRTFLHGFNLVIYLLLFRHGCSQSLQLPP